jgi:hypothetical protein
VTMSARLDSMRRNLAYKRRAGPRPALRLSGRLTAA